MKLLVATTCVSACSAVKHIVYVSIWKCVCVCMCILVEQCTLWHVALSMLLLFVMPSLLRPCSIPATTRYVHIYWASWIDTCPLLLIQCRNLLPSTQGSWSKYNAIFTCQQTHHNIDTSVSNSQPITKLKQLVLKATWTTSHFPWFAYIYMLSKIHSHLTFIDKCSSDSDDEFSAKLRRARSVLQWLMQQVTTHIRIYTAM